MTLAKAQRLFSRATRREATWSELEEAFVSDERLSAPRRMEIYAGAFFARQLGALREFYPKTTALLGAEFAALGRRFILERPGRHAPLETMTLSFPEFLADNRYLFPSSETLIELAELEKARTLALVAPPAEEPLTLERLEGLHPDAKLRLASGIRFVLANSEALQRFDAELIEEGPRWVLFTRRRFAVHHRVLASDEYGALLRLKTACSLADLCEEFLNHSNPAERAHQVVSAFLQDGVLCLPSEPK